MTTIPNLHVTTVGSAKGAADVFVQSRKNATHTGVFTTKISVSYDPSVMDYPLLSALSIQADFFDEGKVSVKATSIELMNSVGKYSPTIYLVGRCTVKLSEQDIQPKGCKYWLTITDNTVGGQETPSVIGFAIIDNMGKKILHGAGPVKSGNIAVQST